MLVLPTRPPVAASLVDASLLKFAFWVFHRSSVVCFGSSPMMLIDRFPSRYATNISSNSLSISFALRSVNPSRVRKYSFCHLRIYSAFFDDGFGLFKFCHFSKYLYFLLISIAVASWYAGISNNRFPFHSLYNGLYCGSVFFDDTFQPSRPARSINSTCLADIHCLPFTNMNIFDLFD